MNEIVCAESYEYLKTLDDESVDIVLTSPPYNFGMGYDSHKDQASTKTYVDMLLRILKECQRVLKSGGRLIINIQPNYKGYCPTHHYLTTG